MYGTYMNANVGPAAPAISPKPAVKKPDSALREIYTIAIVGVVFLLIALTFYTHSDGAGRSAVVFIIIAVGVAYTITFHEHHMVCFDDAAASTSTPPAAPGQPLATPPSLIIRLPHQYHHQYYHQDRLRLHQLHQLHQYYRHQYQLHHLHQLYRLPHLM